MTLFGPDEPTTGPSEPGGRVRVRLTVAYDGTGFHGFAAQPGQTTVGGTLAEAIEKVVGHEVSLTGPLAKVWNLILGKGLKSSLQRDLDLLVQTAEADVTRTGKA